MPSINVVNLFDYKASGPACQWERTVDFGARKLGVLFVIPHGGPGPLWGGGMGGTTTILGRRALLSLGMGERARCRAHKAVTVHWWKQEIWYYLLRARASSSVARAPSDARSPAYGGGCITGVFHFIF